MSQRTANKFGNYRKQVHKKNILWVIVVFCLAVSLCPGNVLGKGSKDSLIVTFKDDIVTLDPAVGYDWLNYSVIQSVYSGLLTLLGGEGQPKPDMAKSYSISDDGTLYTFKLKKGLKFHNGREITAKDFKYTLERTLHPKTKSPGASFYQSIRGYTEIQAGKTQYLSGVKVIDKYTLQIKTVQPDASFLSAMALSFSFVVPREEVEKGNFGSNPVGAGAFKVKTWDTKKGKLILEAHRDYHISDLPKLDSVTLLLKQNPLLAALHFERGEVDLLGDRIPVNRTQIVRSNKAYKNLLIERELLQTSYLSINSRIKPYHNVLVRKAIQMLVNKKKIIEIINHTGGVANQVLPPSMSGYDKQYEGYLHSIEVARKLLKEAGYENGFSTELLALDYPPYNRVANSIKQDLEVVNINVKLKLLSSKNMIEQAGDPDLGPLVYSGGLGWIADYPDPSNFYFPLLSVQSAKKGGWNWSFYGNKGVENLALKANSLVSKKDFNKRMALWKKVFRTVMDDAIFVPLYHRNYHTLAQERVKGREYIYPHALGYIVYEQLYLEER